MPNGSPANQAPNARPAYVPPERLTPEEREARWKPVAERHIGLEALLAWLEAHGWDPEAEAETAA